MQTATGLEPEQAQKASSPNEKAKSQNHLAKLQIPAQRLHRVLRRTRDQLDERTQRIRTQEIQTTPPRKRYQRSNTQNNLSPLRTSLNWCAEVQAIEPGLSELVPDLNSDEYTSDDFLTLKRVEETLAHLYKSEYATMKLGFAWAAKNSEDR